MAGRGVVPHAWFLSRTPDCRISQEKTIPDIVKDILDLHGFTGCQFKTTGTDTPLTSCVQYRESALDSISRLMQQAGIYRWREHADGEHTMIIADDNRAAPLASYPDLPIAGGEQTGAIHRLDEEFVMRSGVWTRRDYNFETSAMDLQVDAPTALSVAQMTGRERCDYPGLRGHPREGRTVANLRMQEEEAHHQRRHGQSGFAGRHAGLRIKIDGTDDPEVLVTEVRHQAEDDSHWSGEMWGGRQPRAPSYRNSFVCIPKRLPFWPSG